MTPRVPFLLLLVGVAAVGGRIAWEDRAEGRSEGSDLVGELSAVPDVAPSAGRETSSTWYCPAGTADGTPEGLAEHVVVVTNPTSEPARGELTMFSELDAGDAYDIEVPPGQESRLVLAELGEARPDVPAGASETFLAALVEMDGTDVRVEHEVSGPQGVATGSCATRGASKWHFAWGATTRDARDLLVLFNPFPNDVVVDAVFSTPEGLREPVRWQGLTVPGGRVVAVDVGEDVTRKSHVAATVRARSGSLVVERLQTFDGSLDADGTRLALGRPAPVEAAKFSGAGGEELVALYNPTGEVAKVAVGVRTEDPGEPDPRPFHLVLRPGQAKALDYSQEARIPEGVAYETSVRSTNGVPVVAEQVVLDEVASGSSG